MAVPASALDPSLPDEPFETWLRGVLPGGVTWTYELDDCGEQTDDLAVDPGRDLPTCLAVDADVPSRARSLTLLFHEHDLQYRGGAVFGDELEGTIDVAELSDLEAALAKPLRAFPLSCPEGTTLEMREEYAGLEEWCEDAEGRKQGPYRAWFSTGIYLMKRGRYRDGARTGEWLECSRFERCERREY